MSPLPPEDVLVGRLASIFRARRRDVVVGVGDDAAVVRPGGTVAVSTDVLVAGEDFLPGTDPARLGRKALSVNLSDLAGTGAAPLYALLALGLPRETDPAWVESFARGFHEVAAEYGTAVVGGDLSACAVTFAAVTVLGRVSAAGPLLRTGARAGDELWLSGTLGAAAAGLRALQIGYSLDGTGDVRDPRGRRVPERTGAGLARLLRHQLDPRPMVDLGSVLADRSLASAAIDLSDGLARDIHRLCRASGTGALLERESLPVDSELAALARLLKLDPLASALYGGEDYGLLFAVPRARVAAVSRLSARFAIRRIGLVTEGAGVAVAASGRREPVLDAGFDHFASAGPA